MKIFSYNNSILNVLFTRVKFHVKLLKTTYIYGYVKEDVSLLFCMDSRILRGRLECRVIVN